VLQTFCRAANSKPRTPKKRRSCSAICRFRPNRSTAFSGKSQKQLPPSIEAHRWIMQTTKECLEQVMAKKKNRKLPPKAGPARCAGQKISAVTRAGSPWLYGTHQRACALGQPPGLANASISYDVAEIARTAKAARPSALIERTGLRCISVKCCQFGAVHPETSPCVAHRCEDPGLQDVIDPAGPNGRLVVLEFSHRPAQFGPSLRSLRTVRCTRFDAGPPGPARDR